LSGNNENFMKQNVSTKNKMAAAIQHNCLIFNAPHPFLFSNQFKEGLIRIYDLRHFLDTTVKTLPRNNAAITMRYSDIKT